MALYRQAVGDAGSQDEGESLPSLGWSLDQPEEAARMRRDYHATSLPVEFHVQPGHNYALMATVRADDRQAGARHVGYARPTAIRYLFDGRAGGIGADQLGLESYVVVADASDRGACDDIEPRWD